MESQFVGGYFETQNMGSRGIHTALLIASTSKCFHVVVIKSREKLFMYFCWIVKTGSGEMHSPIKQLRHVVIYNFNGHVHECITRQML